MQYFTFFVLKTVMVTNAKTRKNKAQTSLAEHSEKTWDEVNTRAKNNITLKENKKQKRDYKDL